MFFFFFFLFLYKDTVKEGEVGPRVKRRREYYREDPPDINGAGGRPKDRIG